jgi:hypothetical protein
MSENDMSELKKGYMVDGQVFTTKAEAEEHMRIPEVKKALTELAGNENSAEWLFTNKVGILDCYKAGVIRRVSKAERAQLAKALDEVESGFLVDFRDAIIESFRWPTVKRESKPEELVREAFIDLCDGNEDLADWLIASKDELQKAYDAGKIKREVSPKALAALAKYRENQEKLRELKVEAEASGDDTAYKAEVKRQAAERAAKKSK